MNNILKNQNPSDNWFDDLYDEVENDAEYQAELLKLDLSIHILNKMEDFGISKAQLAQRLSCSRPFITKMLKGDYNFTVEFLVKLASVFGSEVKISLNMCESCEGENTYSTNAPSENNWNQLLSGTADAEDTYSTHHTPPKVNWNPSFRLVNQTDVNAFTGCCSELSMLNPCG